DYGFQKQWYQLINIHQRTKTTTSTSSVTVRYQLINIHQRTKTLFWPQTRRPCISLSISIREPKLRGSYNSSSSRISLSISIREPKQRRGAEAAQCVSAYQYPSENQNVFYCVILVEQYQLINIHQRTKTRRATLPSSRAYQLINIHQRTKTP